VGAGQVRMLNLEEEVRRRGRNSPNRNVLVVLDGQGGDLFCWRLRGHGVVFLLDLLRVVGVPGGMWQDIGLMEGQAWRRGTRESSAESLDLTREATWLVTRHTMPRIMPRLEIKRKHPYEHYRKL
jgi:hypothetical protein